MRFYQTKQNLGGSPDSILSTKDGAQEYNSTRKELENAVTSAGLTPAPQDGTDEVFIQLAQSQMINGAGASSFQAAGTVDAITLTPVTGAGGLKVAPDYTSLDGFRVGFYPTGANTGNVTISIGQDAGSQFGAKKALNNDGSETAASTLSDAVYAEFIYDEAADASAGAFVLVPYSVAVGGGGGEANTASNVGVGGVGVFKQKVGVDLQFNGINAASSNITVVLDGANNEIDIDLAADPILSGVDSLQIAGGTTAQRNGTPVEGMLRKNTDTNVIEYYNGTVWQSLTASVTLLETRTTTGTWTITSLVIGKPLYIGGDFRDVTVNTVREVRFRVESGSILGASPITGTGSDWEVNSTDGTNPTNPSFVLIPTATSVVIEIGKMDTDTKLVALQ